METSRYTHEDVLRTHQHLGCPLQRELGPADREESKSTKLPRRERQGSKGRLGLARDEDASRVENWLFHYAGNG